MQLTSSPCADLLPNVINKVSETLVGLESMALNAITKTLDRNYILTYSAGIDSTILAKLVGRLVGSATLLAVGREDSSDVRHVQNDPFIKNEKNFRLLLNNKIDATDIERAATETSRLVAVSNLSHFEDCVSFWLASSEATKIDKNLQYIVSANGPDELFCGYDRFRRILDAEGYSACEGEILRALDSAEKLRKEIGVVVSKFGFETKEPFLESTFKEYCLRIPIQFKIRAGNDILRKRIWRCLGRSLGLPNQTVMRPKKAMQYGMGVHAIVLNMLNRNRLRLEFDN